VKTYHAESARAGLESLSRAGLGYAEFVSTAVEMISIAVPYDGICVGTMDPASLMMTRSFKLNITDAVDADLAFLHHEYARDDFAQFSTLARREVGVSILSAETNGDPHRSARFTEVVRPMLGAEHEMRGVARADGSTWAAFSLYRTSGPREFTRDEAAFIESVSRSLAVGIRTGIVATAAANATSSADRDSGPAVLVFDRHGSVIHATPSAERRVAELGGDLWNDPLTAVTALVARVSHGEDELSPRLRVRSPSGEWLVVHAAPFNARSGDSGHVVVTIESATPPEVMPLIMSAYGLTERETMIVLALLRGDSTQEIAQRTFLSPYTVQDHFKSIFEKLGVSSRREVSAKVFYGQYLDGRGTELATSGGFAR